MPDFDGIKLDYESQGFKGKMLGLSPEQDKSVLMMESMKTSKGAECPECGGKVHKYDSFSMSLKDLPIWNGTAHTLFCTGSRFRCQECGKTFTEEVPFRFPGTMITHRAANWIRGFLKCKMTIKAVQQLTGICWETIRHVQELVIAEALENRKTELEEENYHPQYLAVDEFAIHKGHSYATCVMDLETGDVLWVGKGRTKADFEKFFESIDMSTLSQVKAIAMDMNASYNALVEKYMPYADIVYDRYHMQAQFGRDVLGVVRLDEARKHRESSKEILAESKKANDKDTKNELKMQAKAEKTQYSTLKKSRWPLLTNSEKLSETKAEHLKEILESHHDLAVCYAMKEEMCKLFTLTNFSKAQAGWESWFKAAKESNIPALVKFAQQKEKRLPGLVAHAVHQISTGRLEGFNNKIKVAKRIGYGYRNEAYFFSLVRYLSVPSSKSQSPNFP